MKSQFYPIANKLRNFVALLLTLFIIGRTCAQNHVINGDASNYNYANAYPGAIVNGDLVITGNAFNLAALGDNSWENLQTVTGDLTISATNLLNDLNGLQHLTSVGGNLIIQNNTNLSNIASLSNLLSIGGDLIIQSNGSLTSLGGLENVITIGGSINVNNNASIIAFTGNINWAVESVQNISITGNTNLTQLFPFNNITSLNNFTFSGNTKISWLAPFPTLQSVGAIVIAGNTQLTGLGGFNVITSLSSLEVSGNTSLQTCCSLLPLMTLSGPATYINTNGNGCESTSAVNAPPSFDICPPNATVNTDPNSCENIYAMRLPIGSDNCDFEAATVKITRGDGSIWFDGEYGSPGNTFNYPLKPGTNTFAFIAKDLNGNTEPCTTVIQVEDNQSPTPPPGFPVEFYFEAGSNCVETFTVIAEGFVDNCAIDHYNILITQGGTSIANEDVSPFIVRNYNLGIGNYSYSLTAFDVNGLSTTASAPIIIKDGSAPVWDASNLVKLVEIECGETSIQEALTANFPTATDCSGSAEVLIDETINNTTSCGLAENRYLIIAKDGFGATNAEKYDLTIREIDTKKPVLSGVPNSVTIGCNETIPAFPSLTASDMCDGDLTSSITFTEIPGMGSCGNGQIAQTFSRSASISDACGNTTSAQWVVTVLSDFSFSLGDDIFSCSGSNENFTLDPQVPNATYSWSTGASSPSISVNSAGIYKVTITTTSGCCYSDEIEISSGTIPTISGSGGTLDCATGSVQLFGGTSTTGATFNWIGPGNFTSTIPNPSVSTAGQYTLTVISPQGCENTMAVSVDSDTNVPDATAVGGSLSCVNTSVQINGASSTSGVSFSWTGPNNFQSSEQNPTVNEVGLYTLTVTGSNGCNAISTAQVTGNTDVPAITLNADQINCNNPSVNVIIESEDILVSTEWTGPNNFASTEKEPEVDLSGTYIVTVKSANGCEVDFSIEITEDLLAPDLTATGGTISCDANSVELTANSSDNDAEFIWSGPDNFTSSIVNPNVSQPGTYYLEVKGLNGCSSKDSVIVTADTNLPNVSALGGKIDCINEEVTLVGSSTNEEVSYKWTGPDDFESEEGSVVVSKPGNYTFTVVSSSGCIAFKRVEVILDTLEPEIIISAGNVDCDSLTRQFITSTNIREASYEWEGPDGFISDLSAPFYSSTGTYSLTITGKNGCKSSETFEATEDIVLSAEVITNGSSAEVEIITGTGPYTFIWDGSFGQMEASDLEDGEHDVTVIDGFGCSKKYDFLITTSSLIDIENAGSINIFPNPSRNILNINLNDVTLPLEYTIYNIDGTKINTGFLQNTKNSISVENYRSGIYLLKFRMSQKTKVLKFVKE